MENIEENQVPQNVAGENIQSHVNDASLPQQGLAAANIAAANNDTSAAQAEAKAEEKHQEDLEHQTPIGIDHTDPAEREKTLEEHRQENRQNWEGKIKQ